jgi:hypothetical protein
MFVRMIKEEGVRVFILDVVNERDSPQFGPRALPPFENCACQYCDLGGRSIIEIYLLVIIDCHVVGFNHFESNEEGVADKG